MIRAHILTLDGEEFDISGQSEDATKRDFGVEILLYAIMRGADVRGATVRLIGATLSQRSKLVFRAYEIRYIVDENAG